MDEIKKHKRSIGTKIILLCIIVSLVPLIISNGISILITVGSNEKDIYVKLADRTHSVAAQVEEYVNKGYAVVEGLSYGADILSYDPAKQHDILVTSAKNNPYFLLFFQQGLDGMQTARSDDAELGSRAGRWWFEKALQEKKPYVSKSYFSMTGGTAVTSVVIPVNGANGQMESVLAADLNLAKLQEIINKYNTDDTYSILIDGEGSVIAHPKTECVAEMYNYQTATKSITTQMATFPKSWLT